MADLDDGYTRIANELYDALILADINKNEQKVVHAITRCTYGFNKKVDRIADTQLAERTGLSRKAVNFAKNTLIRMKVLVREGSRIGPNKNLSEWDISECHRKSDTVPEVGTKSVPETGVGVSQKQGHTKDIIPKKVKTVTDGESACAETPAATPLKTQVKNTPYQSILDAYHELLPEMPAIRELTDSRKTKIRNFWAKFKFNEERWRAYLGFIAKNCRWMCESRKRSDGESSWKPKNLEFLITEKCYLGVREGRFNDE
ncbi:replication protein [Aeromonas sp.]|uniref:replication protein n=1 Tax=Aeromonas sp. TaxID=647 RepID=UPI00258477C7|nr:replication protein [Aeromonas sp.]MCX7132296.1 replication protein [Aeromonas sp.]